MRGAGGGSCSPCPAPQVWRKPPGVGTADDRDRDTKMMMFMMMSCREDQADDGEFMDEDGWMLCLLVLRRREVNAERGEEKGARKRDEGEREEMRK